MNIFDTSYDVEMKVLIFPEYKKNKFIDRHMFYVLVDDYKYNISFEVDTSTHDEP